MASEGPVIYTSPNLDFCGDLQSCIKVKINPHKRLRSGEHKQVLWGRIIAVLLGQVNAR